MTGDSCAQATSPEARRQMGRKKVIHNGHYSIIRAKVKQVRISLHLLTILRHLFRDHVREIFSPWTLTRHSRAPARLRIVTLTQLFFGQPLQLAHVERNVHTTRLALERKINE